MQYNVEWLTLQKCCKYTYIQDLTILNLIMISFILQAHEGWEERSVPGLKWISGDGFDIRPHDGESANKVNQSEYNF